MPKFIEPISWSPADNFELETNAYTVVKSDINHIVVAGPGAGKTELLAQRACFLLQTNTCKAPRKILAISFKRDAAFNLAERVEKRVGKDLSRRFTSYTFDAFSKSLVDRFRNALPLDYRPSATYKIDTNPLSPSIIDLFEKHSPGCTTGHPKRIANEKQKSCMQALTFNPYPLDINSPHNELIYNVLKDAMPLGSIETITFPILSRLAILLLNTNPKIVSYLRHTYSHIFLDEFQDTTALQYELLKTAFLNGSNIITAVGDTKQRIMLWAGAMDGIFQSFSKDFNAVELPLIMNFRSAPRLVQLQNHLVKELMDEDLECIARKGRPKEEGVAEFWLFNDHEQEARILAGEIQKMIKEKAINPREICLLYKQRPDIYAQKLQEELTNLGINARVENDLQELLVEPIIKFLLDLFFSSLLPKSFEERDRLLGQYSLFRKVFDELQYLKLEKEINQKLKMIKGQINSSLEWEPIEVLILNEINEISFEVFSSYYPQYNEKTFFDECIKKFLDQLKNAFIKTNNFLEALNQFSGKDCLPIMTIHKSKGLEFSIVFFVGFEDQNFWSFKTQPKEDTCSFFVALSRAKDEVYFTFSEERINNFGNNEFRTMNEIDPLLSALDSSELVDEKDFREESE